MGQIKTHHVTREHNPRTGEHVIASSIHKHSLAYVFVPLAVT